MTATIEAPDLSDIAPDLERVGLTVGNEKEATFAQQLAALTLVQRRMFAINRDIDALDDAHLLEVRALTDMHHQQTASERARLASFKQYALTIAALMDWPDRKKSSSTPYGTAGVTDTKPSLVCDDRHATATALMSTRPEFVVVGMKVPLDDARQTYTDAEILEKFDVDVKWSELKEILKADKTAALPPGVSEVPAARTPFVKLP